MTHSKRAQAALARLPEVDPAIAALALWCQYRDIEGPTTTEGDSISIGPEFPLLPISEQTGLIAHHVLHVALRHSSRRTEAAQRFGQGFRPARFDLACDALVNEMLLQAGHALPRPAVRAADIVALLPPQDRPDNVLTDWDCTRLYTAIEGPGRGSNQDGEIEHYMQTQGFEPDLKGASPDNSDKAVWAGRVEQAMRAGQHAGGGIGTIVSRLGDLPRSIVPWDIRLRRLLNKALSQHPRTSHRRPARAWLARDAQAREQRGLQPDFEPGLVRDRRRPRLVIGVDTSSSVSDAMLTMFASEAAAIVRRSGAACHLLGFDTAVHTRRRFDRAESICELAMLRGGGTDFEAVFAEADALDPSLIVMLTDLDAPTRTRPTAPVLWGVPERPAVVPDFGELLVMDDLQLS